MMEKMILWLRSKVGGQALVDSFSWIVVIYLAGIIRFEFQPSRLQPELYLSLGLALAFVSFGIGKGFSLYRSRHRVGSFDELLALLVTTTLTVAPFMLTVLSFESFGGMPRSILFIGYPLFLLLAGATRVLRRYRRIRGSQNQGQPVVIYGAGQMAERLIPQLLEDPESLYRPVGLIDDDPNRANRWISGVKMQGNLSQLPGVIEKTGATGIVVAIPRASSNLLQDIRNLAKPLGIDVFILPNFSEILSASLEKIELRNLGIEDLVGRRSVTVESPKVDSLIRSKRVLITGAGGSIGLELSKQVSRLSPRELILLDRDESGLQQAQLSTESSGLLDSANLVLADIRDEEALDSVWARHKPEVVFHAAALKHLPVLERFPSEAWKTNVQGTLNVLNASLRARVGTFVNISTDKAADPSSVLGHSKLLSEQLTAWASEQQEANYLSVRFGNVLGSRGSLVPTLSFLLDNNLPLSITHPEATRFFMTIPEACQLVLQAATEHSVQSIFILDMGEPVKIIDVATRMIELSGKKVDILFTGLRPGEKLHESLHVAGEQIQPSSHPLIGTVLSEALDPGKLPAIKSNWPDR